MLISVDTGTGEVVSSRGCVSLDTRPDLKWHRRWAVAVLLVASGWAQATPDFVQHDPLTHVYGSPADVTMREPDAPREGEMIDIWARVGYSFWWDNAAVYYTTDGTEPAGTRGTATNGATTAMSFVRNEPASPNSIDWLKATLPAQPFETTVKYKVGVWHSGGGIEVFANNTGCGDSVCDITPPLQIVFQYTVLLPWPGRGYPNADPNAGFPGIHFWKEEGVVGNNYINMMIDRNGTVYDIYYPSAGCVQGVGTRNEGYVDGNDTFPPGLPLGYRGQMHVKQAQAGLRIDGVTYWLSNESGDAYADHNQAYITDTNVIQTSSRLVAGGANITVQQYDFSPAGIAFPNDEGGQPVRGICIKRYLLTNNAGSARTVDFYYNADFAINGGDGFDVMFADRARGALVGYDNTRRFTSSSGEYNPSSFGDYDKNVSVYFAAALKLCSSVGSAGGAPATNSWRDSSLDNDAGWVATRASLGPGQTREIDVAIVGGFDNFAGATGTYNHSVAPALDWFHGTSMAGVQSATESYWVNWLAGGVTIDTPDDNYDVFFRRALLATALHFDANGGGVIAGMHNGAYPFIWPRDALYAAVTFDRTGHALEAGEVFRFLRDVAYRANDAWGKGFWYQKYTTDGYIVWNSPQVDETANVPWAGYYHYLTTGSLSFLNNNYAMFYEAGRAMSEDSGIDSRLYYDDPRQLMHGNNVWEDSWDTFLYSNATVERGLRDSARIAALTGHAGDQTMFNSRADAIHTGLNWRLDENKENTDISQIGLVWPCETHSPVDARAARIIDRINGVAADGWGNVHPLVNFTGEWQGLVNRYWGDTYWNGGPWFLSTLWYGQYYAKRQDFGAGQADMNNFKSRLDLAFDRLGPMGLGAEQIAPAGSLLYPGQIDFALQAAWPNAWESMSTIADSLMLFLDHVPDAADNRIRLAPKLPSAWNTMAYRNIAVGNRRFDVTCTENAVFNTHEFRNVTGGILNYDTYVRIPAGKTVVNALQDGSPIAFTFDPAVSRVHITGSMNANAGSITTVKVVHQNVRTDLDHDGDVDADDLALLESCATGPGIALAGAGCEFSDFDQDNDVDQTDFAAIQHCYRGENLPADPDCAN
jgi:hypothetical protein